MTKKELDTQARMLADSQQKFVNGVHMMCDAVEALKKYIHGFRDSMEAHQAVMDAQGEEFKAALGAFEASMKVFADVNVTVGTNSEKLDKFIVKMESYFGSGTGLEYDN